MRGKLDEIIGLLAQLVAKPRTASPRLLRLADAADYLCISTWKMRALIQAGELEFIAVADGGHGPWLLDVRDLDAWIERTKRTA